MSNFKMESSEPISILEEKREVTASFNLKKSKISDFKNSVKQDVSPKIEEISKENIPKIKNKIKNRDKNISKEIVKKAEKIIVEENFPTPSLSNPQVIQESDSPVFNENIFIPLEDGSYAVKNQGISGVSYKFLSNPDPNFPSAAKKLGFSKTIEIRVKFLINLEGTVEDIIFYGDDPGMGFREEVRRALKKWRVTPVTLDGKKVKLFFYKGFTFKVN